MSDDYLDNLSLSREEKSKILDLGVSSAPELLAMMRASPEAFEEFLGKDRSRAISGALEAAISHNERTILNRSHPRFRATGAIVNREAPSIQPPKYDVAERDRLFQQLQNLRRQHDSSPGIKRRIAELEHQLNTLLENA
jgi:hypothetical protein